MKHVNLGGSRVHPIGIGTWRMGENIFKKHNEINSIRKGLELGANVIDTAEMYGSGKSEKLVGEAIKGYDRESLFIISKFYPQNAAEPRLSHSLDNTLSRLGVDYLDMYLLHWKGHIPFEKMIYDLENLVYKGKIKSWGVSNFDTQDIIELMNVSGGENCSANEDLYNFASRGIEYSLLPLQKKLDIPLIAYAPIDQGDSRGANILSNNTVLELAYEKKCTPSQLILAWSIRNGTTISIPQTSNIYHMEQNVQSADISLTEKDLEILNTINPPPRRKENLDII